MYYVLSFLEGITTFISPCLLPMLPIYISYFAGQKGEEKKHKTLINALGFVIGFTIIFTTLGAFAGSVGNFLVKYNTILDILSGTIIILFGLNFMEIIRLPLINLGRQIDFKIINLGFLSSVLFGIIFAIGWTPCVGMFLGSALMFAARSNDTAKGIIMLLCFSLGLGIPFVVSAILINKLKGAFDFIKKNYKIVNLISGGLLVVIGILIIIGLKGKFLSLFTF